MWVKQVYMVVTHWTQTVVPVLDGIRGSSDVDAILTEEKIIV